MKTLTSSLLAAVLLVGSPVFAIESGAKGGFTGGLKAGDTQVSITSDLSVEAETSAETQGQMQASSQASETISGEASIDVGVAPIVIKAKSLDATADASVKSSSQVQSNTTLNSYAHNVVKTSADIRDVSLTDTEVSVTHRVSARIFGIFPGKVFARATVASDGRVAVHFPWYVFDAQQKAELETKVKAAVKAHLPSVNASARAQANAQAKLTASSQAQILEQTVVTMDAALKMASVGKPKNN